MADAQDYWLRASRNTLRKKRMAVLPGTYASRNRTPYRPKKQQALGVITESDENHNRNDAGRSGLQSVVSPVEYDFVAERSSRKMSQSSTLSGFIASGAEFVRSFSQYSLPATERTNSLLSLPEVQSFDRKSTATMFSINLQSMVLGTSLLSFPFAFLKGGIYAIPLTVIIGTLSCYTGSILRQCLYQQSSTLPGIHKRVHSAFVDICVAVWPKYGKCIMEGLVYFSIVRNTVVLVLLTDLLVEIIHHFILVEDERVWTCAWTAASLPFLFIASVSALAYVSFIGLLLYSLAIFGITASIIIYEDVWDFKYLNTSFNLQGIGLATGIIINSYSQHLSFPALEGSLQNPGSYKGTLQLTFLVNIVMKIGFGLVGVLNFGPKTAQTITGNLVSLAYVSYPIRIAIMFFTYFTIPLQSFVTFRLIDDKFLPFFPLLQKYDGSGNLAWLLLSRAMVMTFCLLVAVLVPNFGVILSLIGSIRGSLIALIFPAMFHYLLFSKRSGNKMKILDIFTIFTGCFLCVIGLYGSIREMLGV